MQIAGADILAAIAHLSDRITTGVAAEVTAAERRRVLLLPDAALDAWSAYHRGLDLVFRFDPKLVRQAQDYFRLAARLDPGFTRAHAGLSFCHYFFAFSGLSLDRETDKRAALSTAERAMQIDDGDPTAHWSYGRALWLTGQSAGGLAHARHAVSLSPNFAHAQYMVGFIEAHHGDPLRALDQMTLTDALSPFDPFLSSVQITRAVACLRLDRLAEAADWARKAASHGTAYSQLLGNAALILSAAGHSDEARRYLAAIHRQNSDYSLATLFRSLYGLTEEVQAIYRREAARIGLKPGP